MIFGHFLINWATKGTTGVDGWKKWLFNILPWHEEMVPLH